jgi:hypothetical protein
MALSAGRLDLTNYFDLNGLANDESTQFLSDALVNNQMLGLSSNGTGAAVEYDPKNGFRLKFGLQQSNTDAINLSDSMYTLTEVGYTLTPFALPEGTYRAQRDFRPRASRSPTPVRAAHRQPRLQRHRVHGSEDQEDGRQHFPGQQREPAHGDDVPRRPLRGDRRDAGKQGVRRHQPYPHAAMPAATRHRVYPSVSVRRACRGAPDANGASPTNHLKIA